MILLLLLSRLAFAYPEMIRHNYPNCISCHTSSTGTGLLNEYGRTISKDPMSHGIFFFESKDSAASEDNKDENFLYGMARLPKGLQLGGDLRGLQVLKDNSQMTMGRFIVMQADLEGNYQAHDRVNFQLSVGRSEPSKKATRALDYVVSRRHWVELLVGEGENKDKQRVRLGRFFPAFGIQIAEHTAVSRTQNGFNQFQETYNAEYFQLWDEWSAVGTIMLGRLDNTDKNHEHGFAIQVARAFHESYKVGANILWGRDDTRLNHRDRTLLGVFGQLGFRPDLYALEDFSLSNDKLLKWGFAHTLKFGWEFSRGVHAFFLNEFGRQSFAEVKSVKESYGFGLQYFPRPHWEFYVVGRKERNLGISGEYDNVAWLLLHYYL